MPGKKKKIRIEIWGLVNNDTYYRTYNAVITLSIFSQILTIDTPQLAREGELWGVCYEFEVWFKFCTCHCRAKNNSDKLDRIIMALDCINSLDPGRWGKNFMCNFWKQIIDYCHEHFKITLKNGKHLCR